jgi:uncharacterized protein YhbP (UPF0306 family)
MHNELQTSVLNFLKSDSNITAVLGTVSADGLPRTALIYYSIDDVFTLYFLTVSNTQKYKNLLENPHVAITIGFGPAQTSVQGIGIAEALEIDSPKQNSTILTIRDRLQNKGFVWPVLKLTQSDIDDVVVFKVTFTELYLLNLEQNNELTFKEEFQKII